MRQRLFKVATMAVATAALIPVMAGCGGGGGSSNGGGSARSVSINAVQGARQARSLLGLALDFGFGGTAERRSGRATSAARSATRIAAWARHNTVAALKKNGASRQAAGDVIFDEEFQLYYKFEETDTSFRLNYFQDAEATQSVGFISLVTQGDPQSFPLTFVLNYNLTAGEEPGSGRLNIRVNDENGETTSISGTVSDTVTGVKTEFDLMFVDFGNSTTGDIRVADNDGTVEFRNLALDATGGFSADLVYGDARGHLTEDPDGGGTLTLSDAAGPIVCVWNADGAGTITLPDGTVQTISDFDDEA